MPNPKPFGHSLKILMLSGCALMMAACSTTTPVQTQQRTPVAQQPTTTPTAPTPVVSNTPAADPKETQAGEIKTPDAETPEEAAPQETYQTAEPGIYFNNRDGLTPPHMAGRTPRPRSAIHVPRGGNGGF